MKNNMLLINRRRSMGMNMARLKLSASVLLFLGSGFHSVSSNVKIDNKAIRAVALVQLRSSKVYAVDSDAHTEQKHKSDVSQASRISTNANHVIQVDQTSGNHVIEMDQVSSSSNTVSAPSRNTISTSKKVALKQKLDQATAMSNQLRHRIMMFTMGIGLPSAVVFALLSFFYNPIFVSIAAAFCLVFSVMGILPTDVFAVRLFVLFGFVGASSLAMLCVAAAANQWFVERHEITHFNGEGIPRECGADLPDVGCGLSALLDLLEGLMFFSSIFLIFPALRRIEGAQFYDRTARNGFRFKDQAFKMPARLALEQGWLALRFFLSGLSIVKFVLAISLHLVGQDQAPWFTTDEFHSRMAFSASFALIAMIFTSKNRQYIISWITSMVTKQEAREAASIAALLGDVDPAEGLTMAEEKFRSISVGDLAPANFKSNREAQGQENALFNKTKPASLGSCDAFLSHSWTDDGPKKYEALRQWADEFHEENGREPEIWLDKACINQTKISEDLLCLPMFLAGCERLVIIAGPSYTSRLWCILEVFTFLKMGGDVNRITILPINMGDEHQAQTMFEKVDVTKCECFKDEDTKKLQGIIKDGFGNLGDFNNAVRTVFKERMCVIKALSNKPSSHKESEEKQSAEESVVQQLE